MQNEVCGHCFPVVFSKQFVFLLQISHSTSQSVVRGMNLDLKVSLSFSLSLFYPPDGGVRHKGGAERLLLRPPG